MPANLESVFQLIERAVWIVTARAGERRGGLVATWVMQASIDPQTPVVAAAIAVNHFTRELIDESGAFALHLLGRDQAEIAFHFGLGSGRNRDKLAGIAWRAGQSGSPLLEQCLAWLDCRIFDRHDGGDRIYYWADVLACGIVAQGGPLMDRALFAAASDEQKRRFRDEWLADIAIQRPLFAAWRESRRDPTAGGGGGGGGGGGTGGS